MTTTRGRVREWHDDDGWGVVDSVATPGGCWTHYSTVLIDGYKKLATGEDVELSFEEGGQDGYAYRAVEVWPVGQEPVRIEPEPPGPGFSSLTITP